MRLGLFSRISPVPVIRHYHHSPPFVALFDSVLVKHSENPLRAIKVYASGWPAVARAVMTNLVRQGMRRHDAEKAATYIGSIAYHARKGGIRDTLAGYGFSTSSTSRLVAEIASKELAAPGFARQLFEELGLEAKDLVVSPLTFKEFVTNPWTRAIVPEQLIEMPSPPGGQPAPGQHGGSQQQAQLSQLAQAFQKYPLVQQIASLSRSLCQVVSAIMAGASVSAAGQAQALQKAAMATARGYLAAMRRLAETVVNSVQQRVEMRLDDENQRGSKSQGLYGVAGYEVVLDLSDAPVIDLPEITIAETVGERLTAFVRRLLRSTWMRRDRRFSNIYLPGQRPAISKRPVAIVGVDVSGSIGVQELKAFVKTLAERVARDYDPEKSVVAYWSTRIEKVQSIQEILEGEPRPPSGGGTDPRAFLHWLQHYEQTNSIRPERAAVVLMTDGEFYIDDDLREGLREQARRHGAALAAITSNTQTAEEMRKLGWDVNYYPMK